MTQQEQQKFVDRFREALAWMQAIQEQLRANDNTAGPRDALEARLRETELGLKEKLWQLDQQRVMVSDVNNQAALLERLLDEADVLHGRTEDPSVNAQAQQRLQEDYNDVRDQAKTLDESVACEEETLQQIEVMAEAVRANTSPAGAEAVQEEAEELRLGWQRLRQGLCVAEEGLHCSLDSHSQYQTRCHKLGEEIGRIRVLLQELDQELEDTQESKSCSETTEEQMEGQWRKYSGLLQNSVQLQERLSLLQVKGDLLNSVFGPEGSDSLQEDLSSAVKTRELLHNKLLERESRLQSLISRTKDFDEALQLILTKSSAYRERLLAADVLQPDILAKRSQLDQMLVLQKELEDGEAQLTALKTLVSSSQSSRTQYEQLCADWTELHRRVMVKVQDCAEIVSDHESFHSDLLNTEKWMMVMSQKLDSFCSSTGGWSVEGRQPEAQVAFLILRRLIGSEGSRSAGGGNTTFCFSVGV
ncbi:hypothetical protein GOODEAATRI_007820 [Goodea atripinnis]|uniref:SYNE1 n=1 Tax=Goodea atripinnis TaxID=208336 RepID=A0ABV0P2F2_9TELE